MMATSDSNRDDAFQVDDRYEFLAPRYFDFINGESEEEIRIAELWFETSLSYPPSPFMPKIKTGRPVELESLCDFSNAEQIQKESETHSRDNLAQDATSAAENTRPVSLTIPNEDCSKELKCPKSCIIDPKANLAQAALSEEKNIRSTSVAIPKEDNSKEEACTKNCVIDPMPEANSREDKGGNCRAQSMLSSFPHTSSTVEPMKEISENSSSGVTIVEVTSAIEACTPKAQTNSPKKATVCTSSKSQTAKKIASLIRNPSVLKPKNQAPSQRERSAKPTSARRMPYNISAKKGTSTDFAQENQAIKRQKLEGGRSRQILDIKTRVLPHKSKPGSESGGNMSETIVKDRKGNNVVPRRKVYVREPAVPFVSIAEMVKKFQSKTREIELSHNRSLSHDNAASITQTKLRLTLTRPKEPELETAHRARSTKVKSTAELEEEMLANMPKFKARPLNKKILEAPSLPAHQRSTPQLPEFQEFHLKTMERAYQHVGTPSISTSSDSSCQGVHNQGKILKLTEPRTPHLETSLRYRPPKVKNFEELEQEELQKMPKFKARPINKKIFESKGELGVFCNPKRQITVPQEFHFATDERIPPPKEVIDLFDKLSFNSESIHEKKLPRITTRNPFHLHTEERGQEKEKKFVNEIIKKEWEEEKARIPKAKPYPYTTDYPVIPPKPEPKECTRPEAFQLQSLVRHEEEMQRKMVERERMEKEEAHMRKFKAKPIMKDDPVPVPEKVRKPLTQVQEFELQVDHRAVDRAEFDKKIKEKEMMYKRYREEYESAKMVEEEKALKQMRRTMVPPAKPLPNFDNPFLPQKSSKEPTKPKSPNLRVVKRKERRRAVATHMR